MPAFGWAFLFMLLVPGAQAGQYGNDTHPTLWCHNVANCPAGHGHPWAGTACSSAWSYLGTIGTYSHANVVHSTMKSCHRLDGTNMFTVSSYSNPCSPPDLFDTDLGTCVSPEPPAPTYETCDGYPAEYYPREFLISAEAETVCTKDIPPEETAECNNVLGSVTLNGVTTTVCIDSQTECETDNGTYGIVNGEAVCLHEDYGDELPTCDPADLYILDGESWACSTVQDPLDTPGADPDPVDTDADGTPDNQDSDIDGDGTPNGTDTDIDGDGIANADDPTPWGETDEEGEGEQTEVGGGGDCKSQPTCTGDAIQCAIRYQVWKSGCDQIEEYDATDDPVPSMNIAVTDAIDDLDDIGTGITDLTGQGIDSEAGSLKTFFEDLLPTAPACADLTINFFGHNLVISCTKLADFRDIFGYFLYLVTALYLFNLAITPIESKV